MTDGWRLWLQWQLAVAPENLVEIRAVEADQGNWLGYMRVVGLRRAEAKLEEPITSLPAQYIARPLLRHK